MKERPKGVCPECWEALHDLDRARVIEALVHATCVAWMVRKA